MSDRLTDAITEFTALAESLRPYRDLPCVCDESSEEAKEETLARCTPCHIDAIFDETLEHARGVADFLRGMASHHPKEPLRAGVKPSPKTNVIRFQPSGRKAQPEAIWKG